MSEFNDIENADSSNGAEVNDNDEMGSDDNPSLEDFYKLREEKEMLEKTNKKLYARITNLKSSGEKETSSRDTYKPEALPEQSWQEKIELKVEGYNNDEIDFIMKNGGREALKNDYVQRAIEAKREQLKAEQALVSEDTSKSDIEKKYTQDQLSKMSADDLENLIKTGKV